MKPLSHQGTEIHKGFVFLRAFGSLWFKDRTLALLVPIRSFYFTQRKQRNKVAKS